MDLNHASTTMELEGREESLGFSCEVFLSKRDYSPHL
jgi:hypothetical protein